MSSAGSERTMSRFIKAQLDGRENQTEYGSELEGVAIEAVLAKLEVPIRGNRFVATKIIRPLSTPQSPDRLYSQS